MLKSYFVTAYRSLLRYKLTTSLNVIGLSIGLAAYFILSQFVSFELSYDSFHHNADNIYRVRQDDYKKGELKGSIVVTYHALGPAVVNDFPEVESFVRMHRSNGMLNHRRSDNSVFSQHIYDGFYADSTFFSFFDFPLIQGDRGHVLRSGNGMLISETASKKYFGNENPLGKVMELTSEWQGGSYVVEGVFKDIPLNSHMKFDFLFSIPNLLSNNQFKSQGWYWTNFYTYIRLVKGTDVNQFEKKLESVARKYLGSELTQRQADEKFVLQPLTSIHLKSKSGGEMMANKDSGTVWALLVIAILIMFIAWVNYINLTTATATRRLKEICVRKVMGSKTRQLINQLLVESGVMSLIALILAVIVVIISPPTFFQIVGHKIPLQLTGTFGMFYFIIPTLIIGMFLASFYPALIISSFRPTQIFNSTAQNSGRGARIRNGLVVIQFAAATFLMIATLTAMCQLNFMENLPLGLSIDNQLVIRAPRLITDPSYMNMMDRFKNEVIRSPLIKGMTVSSEVPGKEIFWNDEFKELHEEESSRLPMSIIVVDDDYLSSYEIQLIAGRNFSRHNPSDFGRAVMINETAVSRFGFKDAASAVGQLITSGDDQPRLIVGVVHDFHQQSLKQAVSPVIMYFIPWWNSYYTVTVDPTQQQAAIQLLADNFKKVFPENAFEYFFLDEQFSYQYNGERQVNEVVIIFTVIALVVACLGLFGLSSFQVLQRKKEVEIRKILGADPGTIVTMLMRDYLKLVLLAMLISAPLAIYFVNRWLSQFAYRTEIPLLYFTLAGGTALLIAAATVAWHVLKSANTNPVDSIRNE